MRSSHWSKDHRECFQLTGIKVSQCLLKSIIDVIEFTLTLSHQKQQNSLFVPSKTFLQAAE